MRTLFRHVSFRQTLHALLIGLCLMVLAVVLFVPWQVHRIFNTLNIDNFQYRIERLGVGGIDFSSVSFVYLTESSRQTVKLNNINLDWQWQRWLSPHFKTLDLDELVITSANQKNPEIKTDSPKTFVLPKDWNIPKIIPERINIKNVRLALPCPSGTCQLAGSFDAKKLNAETMELNLYASPGNVLEKNHHLQLAAVYSLSKQLPNLRAKIGLDQSITLNIQTALQKSSNVIWRGEIKGDAKHFDEWWLPAFKNWNIQFSPNMYQSAQQNINTKPLVNIESKWELAIEPLVVAINNSNAETWKKAFSGKIEASVDAPSPIAVINAGEFSGDLRFEAEAQAGELRNYDLKGTVNAVNLVVPEQIKTFGVNVNSFNLTLNSAINKEVDVKNLPLEILLKTTGDLQGTVTGNFRTDPLAKKLLVENLSVQTKANHLKPAANIQLDNATLVINISADIDPNRFSFKLLSPAHFSGDVDATSFSLNAKSVNLNAKKIELEGTVTQGVVDWNSIKINTEAALSADKLSHPQLVDRKPSAKAWHWQGTIKGSLDTVDARGELGIPGSLNIKHNLQRKLSTITLDWQVPDIFLLAANPLAENLKAWPSLLSLTRGKINARGNLSFDTVKNSLIKGQTNLKLTDVGGIYDTIIFQGLGSEIDVTTSGNSLRAITKDITVNEVNKGFVIGPIRTAGQYDANIANLMQGKLALSPLEIMAMDGSITTAAQNFDFSKESQLLTININNLSLATLLKQYSTSELSGNGKLSGSVPLEITRNGIRITKGVVSAEPPGGQLKYQSPRVSQLAKTQPNMKLVTDALNDFHYSVLASEVNYDEKGKLVLSVKLQGRNPALEKGRPINLNVNLEEDVPAMLASIQMSSKVTDIVKKRVQEQLRQRKESP